MIRVTGRITSSNYIKKSTHNILRNPADRQTFKELDLLTFLLGFLDVKLKIEAS